MVQMEMRANRQMQMRNVSAKANGENDPEIATYGRSWPSCHRHHRLSALFTFSTAMRRRESPAARSLLKGGPLGLLGQGSDATDLGWCLSEFQQPYCPRKSLILLIVVGSKRVYPPNIGHLILSKTIVALCATLVTRNGPA